jgi:hypothetical protein
MRRTPPSAAQAAAVYQYLNPRTTAGLTSFPPLQDAVAHGGRTAGARYVSFENTFM